MEHVLDNPIWAALTGPQHAFAEVRGAAARFRPEFSLFTGLGDPDGWADLAALTGPGTEASLSGPHQDPPSSWKTLETLDGVQLAGHRVRGVPDPEAVVLTMADNADVQDLVARARPGPFRQRTLELGTYRGIRVGGALVAMAGERMRVPGYVEISAVCTDPAYRGRGLAGRLILDVAAGIQAGGDTPFLSAVASNTSAIRLYERLGFTVRREVVFGTFRTPPS